MPENSYTPLTDDMYKLFESLKASGFTEGQAFELTKTYCTVAFANQAVRMKYLYEERMQKAMRRSNNL